MASGPSITRCAVARAWHLSHKTGKHRRVRFADLIQFKTERERVSGQAMEELAKQAQELALGYE